MTALDRLAAVWAIAGGIVLLAIIAVTSVNVGAFAADRVARLAGETVTALPGYEDFVRLAVAPAALMMLPYCQARRGHVAVDLFVSALPRGLVRALDRLWLAVTAWLALFLAYWMTLGMLETQADGALSPILGWPEWPFYAPGVVSLALWSVVAGAQAVAAPTAPDTGPADDG